MNSEESKIIDQTVEETASVSLAVEESKEQKSKKSSPVFSAKSVGEAYKEGGSEGVLELFPKAKYTQRKDVGFVHFSVESGKNANESVTLNTSGDLIYASGQKGQSYKAQESWKFINSVVNFGKQQSLGTEIEFTMIPAGLQLQLAFSEGYWCIGTANDSYANRKRYGRNDLQKLLSQTLQNTYGVSFSNLEQSAVYTLILSHRDIVPVSINQVFFVKREFLKQHPKDYKEDVLQLPRLQKFRVKATCTRQQSGDRDLQFLKSFVGGHKQLAFSYAQPITHLRAKCFFRQWELETSAGEALRIHSESKSHANKPFELFAQANADSDNPYIAFYSQKPKPRRRNNYREQSQEDAYSEQEDRE